MPWPQSEVSSRAVRAARSAASKASSIASLQAGEGGGGAGVGEGGDGGGVAGGGEGGGEVGPAVLGDEAVGEAGVDGVAGAHAVAGDAEVLAEAAGGAGEERGGADVGDEADHAFRHGDLGRLADDAVAAVAGDADAAAHDEALHQRDVGLGEAAMRAFIRYSSAQKRRPVVEVAAAAGAVDVGDVAAGAEGARAFGVDEDEGDGGVVGPGARAAASMAWTMAWVRALSACGRVRVMRPARPSVRIDDVAHARSARRARATMTRMISLVPSRIWCTRRSRTIFSMP